MAPRSTKTKAAPPETARLAAAVFALAARQGWPALTMDKIARAARLSPAALARHAATPLDLIACTAREVSRQALAASTQGAPRDVLFDLLMARFDVLQKNRAGVLALATAARHDRALARCLAHSTLDAMAATLDAARLDHLPRAATRPALWGVYLYTFHVWQTDATRDMAKTMAALDKALRLADSVGAAISQRRTAQTPPR